MAARSVLWVDLRSRITAPDLCVSLSRSYRVHHVRVISEIFQALRNWLPSVVCFEYDHPDRHGLGVLTEVRSQYRSLPIVMLTEDHSDALAGWAFRNCVWDCLVKPFSVRDLYNCLAGICRAGRQAGPRLSRAIVPYGPAFHDADEGVTSSDPMKSAVSYVEANYAEKIRMATAARLCHLSPFQFSRRFKEENGVTFRDFVLRLRIQRAAQLMKDSGVSVTEAAFGVGFNDLSHFARMFRRQMGMPPSRYRKESEPRQLPLFPPAGHDP